MSYCDVHKARFFEFRRIPLFDSRLPRGKVREPVEGG